MKSPLPLETALNGIALGGSQQISLGGSQQISATRERTRYIEV